MMVNMSADHSCLGKSREINRRTGIMLNHDEISFICDQLGFSSPDQFYAWMATLTDEELKREVQRMMERRRKKSNPVYEYAVA